MTYETILNEINFCTISDQKLWSILDYLDCTEILEKSECEVKFKDGECIEKRWEWYDEILVTPKYIYFSPDPQPSRIIFTAEKYAKMWSIVNE